MSTYLLIMVIAFGSGGSISTTQIKQTFNGYDACMAVKNNIDSQVQNNNGQILTEKCYELNQNN